MVEWPKLMSQCKVWLLKQSVKTLAKSLETGSDVVFALISKHHIKCEVIWLVLSQIVLRSIFLATQAFIVPQHILWLVTCRKKPPLVQPSHTSFFKYDWPVLEWNLSRRHH